MFVSDRLRWLHSGVSDYGDTQTEVRVWMKRWRGMNGTDRVLTICLFSSDLKLDERQAVVASVLCPLHTSTLLHTSMPSCLRLWEPDGFVVLLFLVVAILSLKRMLVWCHRLRPVMRRLWVGLRRGMHGVIICIE